MKSSWQIFTETEGLCINSKNILCKFADSWSTYRSIRPRKARADLSIPRVTTYPLSDIPEADTYVLSTYDAIHNNLPALFRYCVHLTMEYARYIPPTILSACQLLKYTCDVWGRINQRYIHIYWIVRLTNVVFGRYFSSVIFKNLVLLLEHTTLLGLKLWPRTSRSYKPNLTLHHKTT